MVQWFGPRRGIDAQLQTITMDVVRQPVHVQKFVIGSNIPLGVRFPLQVSSI